MKGRLFVTSALSLTLSQLNSEQPLSVSIIPGSFQSGGEERQLLIRATGLLTVGHLLNIT